MDKNEILEKSRKENSKQDEYYADINKSSMKVGLLAMIIACFILMIVDYVVLKQDVVGYVIIITVVNAALYLYKGIKMKDKAFTVCGIIWSVLTVINIANYIINMVG